MNKATITNVREVETIDFPWGAIKWLCNDKIDDEAEQTLGVVYINPGQRNGTHSHPNCEELLYVISGQCEHSLGDEMYELKAGMMIRIPRNVKHYAVNTGWEPVMMLISYSSADRQTIFHEE